MPRRDACRTLWANTPKVMSFDLIWIQRSALPRRVTSTEHQLLCAARASRLTLRGAAGSRRSIALTFVKVTLTNGRGPTSWIIPTASNMDLDPRPHPCCRIILLMGCTYWVLKCRREEKKLIIISYGAVDNPFSQLKTCESTHLYYQEHRRL